MTADDLPETVRRDLEAIDAALAGEPVAPELTELGALALALREDRPRPEPAFTRELDARAAAGFPRRRRAPKAVRRAAAPRRRLTGLLLPGTLAGGLAALALVVVLLPGGAGPSSDDDGGGGGGGGGVTATDSGGGARTDRGAGSAGAGSSAPAPVPTPDADAAREPAAPSEEAGGADSVAAVPPSSGGSPAADGRSKRFVERSTALVLAAAPDAIDRTADRIVSVADRVGGFVVSSSVTAADGSVTQGGGDFLLRVPSARLQEAVALLSRIGHVRERRQTVDDITRERVSAADRLQEARAERASLLRRLAAATTDSESASIRARLRAVNRRISLADAALKRVDNRARYANVAVTLLGDRGVGGPAGSEDDGWTPGDAARDALRVLEVAAGVLLIALAVGVPLALLAAGVVAVSRWTGRRGRERALDGLDAV